MNVSNGITDFEQIGLIFNDTMTNKICSGLGLGAFRVKLFNTLPETNVAPENRPPQ